MKYLSRVEKFNIVDLNLAFKSHIEPYVEEDDCVYQLRKKSTLLRRFILYRMSSFLLEQIKLATCDLLDRKYRAGVQAYQGTKLWTMPAARVVENAIEETIDQITYLLTLRQSMRVIMELAYKGMTDLELTNPTARENCRAIWYTITGKDK